MPSKKTKTQKAAMLPPKAFWRSLVAGGHAIELVAKGMSWQEVAQTQEKDLSARQMQALADFAVAHFPSMRPYSPEYDQFRNEFTARFGDVSRHDQLNLPNTFLRATLVRLDENLAFVLCACCVPFGCGMKHATYSPIHVCKSVRESVPMRECLTVQSLLDAWVHYSDNPLVFESNRITSETIDLGVSAPNLT